ncbi:MAG: nitroreductase family protein [Oscillospiraceae bacterium]|jgi:nitroreductase|nr:nitroreductase family protein [Oscillospiraceae bacterium]
MIIHNPTTDVILRRQTVREYLPEPLSESQLQTLRQAALQAPSGRNAQPIHARICTNPAMLAQMQVDFKNIVGWDTPVHTKSDVNPFYHNAPAFVFLFAEDASQLDAGLMCENIVLAAESMGLSSVIVGSVAALFKDATGSAAFNLAEDASPGLRWRSYLQIPSHFRFMIGVGIGYGNEQPPPKPRRKDQIQVIL